MSTAEKIRELRHEFLVNAGEQWESLLDRCTESPIERLFLAAALLRGWEPCTQLWHAEYHLRGTEKLFVAKDGPLFISDEITGFLIPQVTVECGGKRYRIDFAIADNYSAADRAVRLAIELDGHSFHEKSKEQASRDKARERALVLAGWRVLRFTWSDVYRDADACWDEVDEEARAEGFGRDWRQEHPLPTAPEASQ